MFEFYFNEKILKCPLIFCLVLFCFFTENIYSQYSEGPSDLSDRFDIPTSIPISLGDNIISGFTVNADRDFFTITVPSGQVLSKVNLEFKTGNRSFLGFAVGNPMTEDPEVSSQTELIESLLGYTHLDAPLIDQLPVLLGSVGAQGFSIPLPAGDYTFWVQETGGTQARYRLNLVLETAPIIAPPPAPIPILSEWGLITLFLLLLISFAIAIKEKEPVVSGG